LERIKEVANIGIDGELGRGALHGVELLDQRLDNEMLRYALVFADVLELVV